MAVTRSEVLKIAELAKLHFSEDELDEFIAQFQRILEYIAQLKEANVEGVEPTSHVSPGEDLDKCLLRDDEICPSLPVEESMANAPDPGKDHFRVPKVI